MQNPCVLKKLHVNFRGGFCLYPMYFYLPLLFIFFKSWTLHDFFLFLNKLSSAIMSPVLPHSSQKPKKYLFPCKRLARQHGARSFFSPIASLPSQPSPALHRPKLEVYGTRSEEEFVVLKAWLLFPGCAIWVIKKIFLPTSLASLTSLDYHGCNTTSAETTAVNS